MNEPARYEIRVAEHLDTRLAKWFDGLAIISFADSEETLLRGELADQSALFGVLGKIRDLGLTLISVQRAERISPDVRVSTALHYSDAPANRDDAFSEGR